MRDEVSAPPRARVPLLHGDDARRALEVAQHILGGALPLMATEQYPPESISRYGGAALVAESLARAGRVDDAAVRAVLREALVFAPDRLSLFDGAGRLLVVLDAVDPGRESFDRIRARLHERARRIAARARRRSTSTTPTVYKHHQPASPASAHRPWAKTEPEVQRALRAYAHALRRRGRGAGLAADPYGLLRATVNLGVSHGVAGMLSGAEPRAARAIASSRDATSRSCSASSARRRRRVSLGRGVAS